MDAPLVKWIAQRVRVMKTLEDDTQLRKRGPKMDEIWPESCWCYICSKFVESWVIEGVA